MTKKQFYNHSEFVGNLICLFRNMLVEGQCEVVVRFHPAENPSDFVDRWQQSWGPTPPGLFLSKHEPLNEILAKTDVALMFRSTIMLNCLVNDIPVIMPGWIAGIHAFFEQYPEIGVVLGKIRAKDMSHILARMRQQVYERRHWKYTQPDYAERIKVAYDLRVETTAFLSDHVSGGNFAIRREVLEAVGGIASKMRRGADGILSKKLLRAGYAIGYNPDMVIYHDHNCSYRVMYRQGFGEGRAQVHEALKGGMGKYQVARRALSNLVLAPVQIRNFTELLQTDRNTVKIYLIYTSFRFSIAAGQIYEVGCTLLLRDKEHNGL